MPDSLIPPVIESKKRSNTTQRVRPTRTPQTARPLHLVDQIVEVILPLADKEGCSDRDIIAAVSPIIGHYTVADAVLTIGALRLADEGLIFSGVRGAAGNAPYIVANVLHKFICCGAAAGSACAAARSEYALNRRQGQFWRSVELKMLIVSMGFDIDSLKYGENSYWAGSLFGGGTIDPDKAFEPEDWWDRGQRLLSRYKESIGNREICLCHQRSSDLLS